MRWMILVAVCVITLTGGTAEARRKKKKKSRQAPVSAPKQVNSSAVEEEEEAEAEPESNATTPAFNAATQAPWATEVKETPPSSSSSSSRRKQSLAFNVQLAGGVLGRAQNVVGDSARRVTSYSLPGTAAFGLLGGVDPWSFAGFVAEFSYAPITSTGFDKSIHKGGSLQALVGGRAFVDVSQFTFAAAVGFGMQTFDSNVPDFDGQHTLATQYTYLRPGADVTLRLSNDFLVEVNGGYLAVLGNGELGEFYPSASGSGFDVGLGASYRVFGPISLVANGKWRHYAFTLDAASKDTLTDDYYTGFLGVAFRQ